MNRRTGTLLATILGSGVVFLDSTVVNVALQRIGQDLPSRTLGVLEAQSYVYNAYLLTLSALLILAGALADTYGRRRIFAIGLAAFGGISMLCGLAPSMEFLIAARAAQGAAGALLVPGSLALLTAEFNDADRGRAFGIWAAAASATSILGPLVGGLLVQTLSWRAVFFINVPLIAAAIWVTSRHVVESHDPGSAHRLDWLGAILAAVALGGLSFGAIYGQQHEWQGVVGPLALGVGAVASVVFVVAMATRPNPLVPLSLFRSRNFLVVNVTTFLIYGALYVVGYNQSIFLQGTLGYTASAAGMIAIPGSVLVIAFSARFGALGARHGARIFMIAGPALMAAGLLWYARVPADSPPWRFAPGAASTYVPTSGYLVDFLPGGIVFGLGLAMLIAPLTTTLMSSAPASRAGLASAINNSISRVGPQLAGAAVFVGITALFYSDLAVHAPGVDVSSSSVRDRLSPLNPPDPSFGAAVAAAARQASVDSFRLAMLLAAGLLLAGAVVNAVGIVDRRETRGARTPTDAATRPGADPDDADDDADDEGASGAPGTTAETGA